MGIQDHYNLSKEWEYATVTADVVAALRGATAPDRVFWRAESDASRPGTTDEITEHSRDKSFHHGVDPDVVVYCTSVDEAVAVVRIAGQWKIPVTSRGAGTGVEGAAIPIHRGMVLDTSRMKKIELNKADMVAVVGPGVRKMELNKFLANHGLLFGPDPSSNPCIGGMASTSGSGLSTLKYGTTRENIVSMKVVTPQGHLITTRQAVRKSSTGYELNQLYIGAEGTLGVIVELTVRVVKLHKHRVGALVKFPDVRNATDTVVEMVGSNLSSLLRCELLNAEGVLATNKLYQTQLEAVPTLFLEFTDDDKQAAINDSRVAESICAKHGSTVYMFAEDGADLDKMWEARRGCYIASMKYRGISGVDVFLSDVCVPVSKLADCVTETEQDFKKAGFPCVMCAHIADGNFHCLIPYTKEEQPKMLELETNIINRAISMGGTLSGEHGVGLGKVKHMCTEHGEHHLDIQRGIKLALDPDNIMNPGKIFTLSKKSKL